MSLNWLRIFIRRTPARKVMPRPPLALPAPHYDPVRAAFEAECG